MATEDAEPDEAERSEAEPDPSTERERSDPPAEPTEERIDPPAEPTEERIDPPAERAIDPELEAIHEVELGLEWLQRAHGALLEFHHATGHGMDHLAVAEGQLRDCGHDALADALRDDLLPRGVVDEDRWSYDLVEEFQSTILADVQSFETRARRTVTDGERHVAERAQRRDWKRRARR